MLASIAVDRALGQTVVTDELPNYEVVRVLQGLENKLTDFAWTPDKRFLTFSETGALDVYDGETFAKLQAPALDLSDVLCLEQERGGFSVTVHPEFDGKDNQYIYLFYVRKGSAGCPDPIKDIPHPDGPVSRLSRFVLPTSNIIDPSSEEILFETGPVALVHMGGHVAFGKDDYMYVTTGDAGYSKRRANVASRPDNLYGKILRFTDDGNVPSDNPYVNISDTSITSIRCNDRRVPAPTRDEETAVRCQEVFSLGLRNPFNIAMDPTTTEGVRFLIGDVGMADWEEVNEGGTGYETKDYGWNDREGPCLREKSKSSLCIQDERYVDPIHWWPHPGEGFTAVTGGVFVPAEAGWPEQFTGEFLFSDFMDTTINHLRHDPSIACRGEDCAQVSSEYEAAPIVQDIPDGVLRMYFGPFEGVPTLFFLSYEGKALYRLSALEGSNRRPTAVIDQFVFSSSVGSALTVQFDGSRSFDPDGDLLSYEWNFGESGSELSNEMVTSYTYSNPGQYTVTLTVSDGNGGTAFESVDVNVQDLVGSPLVFPWRSGDACPPGYDFCGVLEFCKDGLTYGYRLPCQEECTAAQAPVIRVQPGKKYSFTLRNVAPEGVKTNIHPHGLHVGGSGDADDVTRSVTAGNCLDYTWDILPDHPGGTYWYHPHPHGRSEEQVVGGAFGMLIVEDNQGEIESGIPDWASNELLLQIAYIDGAVWGNGKHYEVINVSANQWYRLRVSVVDPLGAPLNLRFTNGCTVHKVSSDGVWHSSVPGPSADRFELTGASRADFAIRCTDPEGSTVNMLYDGKVVAIVNIGSEEPEPYILKEWMPKRPAALQNIASASVPDENRFNITIQRQTLNQLEWDPDVPLKTIAFDQVHEWVIANSTKHPFHLHLYHMLVMTPGGCGAHKEGEFYDTIAGPTCTVRFRTADIGQRCVFHCHVMEHGDLGAIGWVDVQGQGMPVNNIVSPEYTCPSPSPEICSAAVAPSEPESVSSQPTAAPVSSDQMYENYSEEITAKFENITISYENVGPLMESQLVQLGLVMQDWFNDYYSATEKGWPAVVRDMKSTINAVRSSYSASDKINIVSFNQQLQYQTFLPVLKDASLAAGEPFYYLTLPYRDVYANLDLARQLRELFPLQFADVEVPLQVPEIVSSSSIGTDPQEHEQADEETDSSDSAERVVSVAFTLLAGSFWTMMVMCWLPL